MSASGLGSSAADPGGSGGVAANSGTAGNGTGGNVNDAFVADAAAEKEGGFGGSAVNSRGGGDGDLELSKPGD